MKNRITFIFVLFITLLIGCDWIGDGENFPPAPNVEHYKIIRNNSSHIIEVERIWKGEIRSPYILYPEHQKEFFNQLFEEDSLFFPALGDTTRIIYDDTISVFHTKAEVQDVSRSIMLESSYTGGKVNDKLYEIYYTFTDADYDEAVLINEGG